MMQIAQYSTDEKDISQSPVTPNQLGSIIDLIDCGDISGRIAKELFEIVYTEGGDPSKIVKERGMKQVTDTGAIEESVNKVIADNPDKVEKAKLNPKLVGWFVGQVMKSMGGKANPKSVNELVKSKLRLQRFHIKSGIQRMGVFSSRAKAWILPRSSFPSAE